MTTSARAIAVLLALGLVVAAPAAAAEAAPSVAKLRVKVKNWKPKLGRAIERKTIGVKARLGRYRQNELVEGKTRAFHTAGGGTRTEKTTFEVVGKRALTEQVEDQTFDAHGKSTGGGKISHGNIRRVFGAISAEIAANLDDPDVKAARRGDQAAKARWNARFEAHRGAKRASRPHRFVDRNGNARFLEGASDVGANPVPPVSR